MSTPSLSHRPLIWEDQRSLKFIQSCAIRAQAGKLWTPEKHNVQEAPVSFWTALYLADISGRSIEDARKSHQHWVSLCQLTLQRASLSILPYAAWWMLEGDRTGNETPVQLFQWRNRISSESFLKGADERDALLLSLADDNLLPRAPSTILNPGDVTLNLLDRDAHALWACWTWFAIPSYERPLLTLWCTDPVSARVLAHDGLEGKISAVIQPKPPLSGKVNTGCVSAKQWINAAVWQKDLFSFFSFN